MNVKIDPAGFKQWLTTVNFAQHGDEYERKYHSLLSADFPTLEQFWRVLVVPLTTRMYDYPKPTTPSTTFREGIGEDLQRICAANYSVFMHLAYAKQALVRWDEEFSLDTVYVRLASAFDVFDSLAFIIWKVLSACRGATSAGLEELDETAFSEISSRFFRGHYQRKFQIALRTGQTVNMPVQNTEPALNQCFEGVNALGDYKRHSGNVRSFRNALVHEVRLGRINVRGKLLVPNPSVVNKYRTWTEILKAASSEQIMLKDFCEPAAQAESDFKRAVLILNQLYALLIGKFEAEFASSERSALRTLFLIEHGDPAQNHFKRTPDAFGKSLVAQPTTVKVPVELGWSAASGVAYPER